MIVNSISPVRVNTTNGLRARQNAKQQTGGIQQPAVRKTNSNDVTFKGKFGALAGGLMGAVAGGVLTIVTLGAASGAVLPLIAAGAAIGHNEEEKSNKEEQENKNK